MVRYISIIFIAFLTLIVNGCSESHTVVKLTNEGKIAKSYLEDKGYTELIYKGSQTYSFSKKDLSISPYNEQIWSVQTVNPDNYLSKKIDIETFYINNHPLDKIYKSDKNYLGRIKINVWIFEEKVIGGTSFPLFKENVAMVGAPYSLEGKSGEEVKGNLVQWLKRWKEKYGTRNE